MKGQVSKNGRYLLSPLDLFEDMYYQEMLIDKFDFIFTSPPFFKYEKYGDVEVFGDTVDEWLELWMFPVLDKAIRHLNDEGHLILYIADTVSNIVDPILNYLNNKLIQMKLIMIGTSRTSR
ncbi:hypothetical protein GEMRC1_012547 [Eukaryota sp. GEM-RC1]